MDYEDVVGGGFDLWEGEADGFVEAAADAVAADGGFEDFFADDYGEALLAVRIWVKNKRYLGVTNGGAVFIGVTDAATRMESIFFS